MTESGRRVLVTGQIVGRIVDVAPSVDTRPDDIPIYTRPDDIPIYITDCAHLYTMTEWRPRRGLGEILAGIHASVVEREDARWL